MRWPYKKLYSKGKRRISQRQSHHKNIEREMRNESVPTRRSEKSHAIDDFDPYDLSDPRNDDGYRGYP